MTTQIKANKKSDSHNRYFSVLLLLFPVIILILFELLLRGFGAGDNLDLFINHPNKNYKDYYLVNPLIGEKYFSKFEATKGSNDILLKKKPDNGYRIFVLGSSTMVGFPYDRNLMSSRILHKRLEDAYPDKHIEVVNTAITAINSITLRDYLNDIIKHEPDALLFYAGHNEYYGAFGVGSHESLTDKKSIYKLHFKLMKLRTYQLTRKLITKIASLGNRNGTEEKGSLMKRIVADKSIVYNSEKYHLGINQYKSNLIEILNICEKEDVDVFISEIVSNIKDLPPFGSSEENEGVYSANSAYAEANEFVLNSEFEKAKEQFTKAKDYDCVRFRATETINAIIDSLAEVNNCKLIQMPAVFEHNSENKLVGDNLFTEHVHPNISGQFVMADAFFKSILNSELIDSKPDSSLLKATNYYKLNWGYTVLDSLIGVHKVNQLKTNWPFVSSDYNGKTYRDMYKPNTIVDSLAFTVLQYYAVNIEDLHKHLGDTYFKEEQYEKAYWEYESLVRTNPYFSNYLNLAAQSLLKLNEFALAETYLLRSIDYKSTYFAQLLLGEINMFKQDFNLAIEAYSEALELTDDKQQTSLIHSKLYAAYTYNNELRLSEDILNEIKKNQPDFNTTVPELNYSLSEYIPAFVNDDIILTKQLLKESKYDSAQKVLMHSIKKWDTPYTNKLLGDILYDKQDNSLLLYYNKAYTLYYKDPNFLAKLCVANYVNKNKKQTEEILNQLIEVDPENAAIVGLKTLVKKLK